MNGSHPFWSDTDSSQNPSGKIGFSINGDVLYSDFELGLFLTRNEFSSDGTQTSFQLNLYGVYIGYHFDTAQ